MNELFCTKDLLNGCTVHLFAIFSFIIVTFFFSSVTNIKKIFKQPRYLFFRNILILNFANCCQNDSKTGKKNEHTVHLVDSVVGGFVVYKY